MSVAQLKPKEAEAPQPKRALGYSISMNLGMDDKGIPQGNIVLQHFVDEDAPLAEVNAAVDKAVAVAQRQQAKYRILDLQQGLARACAEYDHAEEDQRRLDDETAKGNALRDVQIATLQGQIDIERGNAHTKHVQSGREGAFKLQGFAKANIERAQAQVDKLKAEQQQALEVQRTSHQGRKDYRARMGAAIAHMEADIASCEALIGG
jgi:hypothetical protein